MVVSPSLAALHFVTVFFFNDTATTEIYTLFLHDALPISVTPGEVAATIYQGLGLDPHHELAGPQNRPLPLVEDRKSTRLNSSHSQISYAVFCLKKKKRLFTPVLHT